MSSIGKPSSGFTRYQLQKLESVKHDPQRYYKLMRWFRGYNETNIRGRVLSLKGEVLHVGFEIIKRDDSK